MRVFIKIVLALMFIHRKMEKNEKKIGKKKGRK